MSSGITIQLGFAESNRGGFLFPTCTLIPEQFGIQQNRTPSIIALPMQNASGRGSIGHGSGVPRNILIDFGGMEETITISGKIPDEDQSQVQGSLNGLISRLRTNWVTSPTVVQYLNNDSGGAGLIKVQLTATNPSYVMTWTCTSMRSNFDRNAGDTFWTYKLILGVIFYPEQASGGFVS